MDTSLCIRAKFDLLPYLRKLFVHSLDGVKQAFVEVQAPVLYLFGER